MTVERAFLLACAVGEASEWNGREAVLRELGPADWRALHALALHHGFAGLMARNLGWAAERLGLAIPIVEPLERVRAGQLAQHLTRKAAARRVADALQSLGIPFVFFKGIALAEEVYGDLSLRGFRDLDVLVPSDRVDEAFAACLGLGYRLTMFAHVRDHVQAGAHAAGMVHADGSGVDLHWSLAPDLLEPERIARMWEGVRPAPEGPYLPGLRLSPETTLVHLAKHFHSHQYTSPKPLVDFYTAARRQPGALDAGRLEAAARGLGLSPVIDIAAGLCARCFIADALPPALRSRADTQRARRAGRIVVDDLLLNAPRRSRFGNWTRFLLAAGGPAFAWASLREMLVPGRLTLAQFFGRPYSPAMYPRYYWRQFVKVVTLSST